MSFITRSNVGRWWGCLVEFALIACMVPVPLLMAYGGLGGFARAQETIPPLVADADGKPICGEWLKMLRGNPSETVLFTGGDRYGQKVKVLVDGQSWRFVILAGDVSPKFGCEFLAGDGFSSR